MGYFLSAESPMEGELLQRLSEMNKLHIMCHSFFDSIIVILKCGIISSAVIVIVSQHPCFILFSFHVLYDWGLNYHTLRVQ